MATPRRMALLGIWAISLMFPVVSHADTAHFGDGSLIMRMDSSTPIALVATSVRIEPVGGKVKSPQTRIGSLLPTKIKVEARFVVRSGAKGLVVENFAVPAWPELDEGDALPGIKNLRIWVAGKEVKAKLNMFEYGGVPPWTNR
ncbi:MAG: hypothetical protein GY811_11865 [Myxococcales bacterium]|nr:hypothetical protein [Myxococcales bacterium]